MNRQITYSQEFDVLQESGLTCITVVRRLTLIMRLVSFGVMGNVNAISQSGYQ